MRITAKQNKIKILRVRKILIFFYFLTKYISIPYTINNKSSKKKFLPKKL